MANRERMAKVQILLEDYAGCLKIKFKKVIKKIGISINIDNQNK
jgi:hypothetical protein